MSTYASHSSLVDHRECPQAWNYGHVARLRPVGKMAVERDFGSWWQMLRSADALRRGRLIGSLQVVPDELRSTDDGPTLDTRDVNPGDVLDLAKDWWVRQPDTDRALWAERLGEELPDRLWRLFAAWSTRWADEVHTEQPLAVELRWERALDADNVLVGYIDEVLYDAKRALVVVRDNKAHKALATSTAASDMMDSQLQLYAWGASPIITSWGRGRVSATAYDRAATVAPRPPVLTKSGRLAVRNGEPSISACDLNTYLAWAAGPDGYGVPYEGLKKDGSASGYYTAEQSVVERLSTPAALSVWFQRTLTPLNANLVRAHLRSARDSAVDMAASRERVARTGEAARNLTAWGCRWCDFAALCRAQMMGGADGEYDLAELGLEVKPKRHSEVVSPLSGALQS